MDKLIRLAKSNYYDVIIEDAGNDTQKLWGLLNELIDRKQCRHKMPNRFVIDGKSVRNKKNIATAFNIYFSSIGSEMAEKIPNTQGYKQYLKSRSIWQIFNLEELCEDSVMKIMKNQKPNLSCGTDTINNKVVKSCHQELAKPKTIVINK